ncbi:branched-chain amino acid ABC transporter permease [Rhizobium paknamense]|uniref:Branched-chain amino acid transport system permease protein n=1 Tax=Rhizobium paknamense TaxID=1206817 RepID=A0ABU0IEX7_9HYPH|nr:branched-chain amino acid ABC transporter permease [Rhizobium paknamense]MDQ0456797.1 branched-chain amino acid transport system permease protein [Rhizobium paknamense]
MGPSQHRITRALGRTRRLSPLEVSFWLLAVAVWFFLPDYHLILNEIAGFAILALSLDLILGYAGMVSLGQAAMYGLGAYAAGLFSIHVTGEPISGLLVGAACGALLALLTGPLLLRGGDLTRLMVTLGVAAVVMEIANQASWLTGGADGLRGMEIQPLFGVFDFDIFGQTACAYSLVVLFALMLIARVLLSSPFGYSLRAIRDNPLRASAVGIPVHARLVTIYTVSGAYAGIAGALFAQTQQFVSLDALSFQKSADGLMILTIGGPGYLYGGALGALVYKLIQDELSNLTPQYWQFWIGLMLVAFVLIGRERPHRALAALTRRLKGKAERSKAKEDQA